MKINKLMLISMISFLLGSCTTKVYDDWHIVTHELADEYYPKYFEFIEKTFLENDIEYEKEYSEEYYEKFNSKHYIATYNISENIYYKFDFNQREKFGYIDADFKYNLGTEDEILNFPQKYLNVMVEVTNYCASYFSKRKDNFYTFYEELKEKYIKEEISLKNEEYSSILTGERYLNFSEKRGINLDFNDSEYNLEIYLLDSLTDINIWDKEK